MWNPPFMFYKFQHTHNIFLEMTFNFGLPISLTLTSIALFIFFKALKVSFSTRSKDDFYILDKAWICAGLVVLLIHLTDMPFYDGRVSLFICILFSGLRCISKTKRIVRPLPNKL